MRTRSLISLSSLLLAIACTPTPAVVPDGGPGDGGTADTGSADAFVPLDAPAIDAPVCTGALCPDWSREIIHTALTIDLAARRGTARITVAGASARGTASFEVGDLTIDAVRIGELEVEHTRSGAELHVAAPSSDRDVEITIEYAFESHDATDGWSASTRVSFLWPDYCGNLFPCHSAPGDGSTFALEVSGAAEGEVLVYPRTIELSTPAYVPAIAAGAYTEIDLGTTEAGTRVSVWHLPGSEARAMTGTRYLREELSFMERTLGAYRFGAHAGSVEAPWGPGAYGGMEHHPYWHVGSGSFGDGLTHAHEAAHGWFGDGVRIACWEDFVLSEGLASYLAARAIEAVEGETAGEGVWAGYRSQLEYAVRTGDTIALPDESCDAIEIISHPLWSSVPYMKGAFFMRAVETGMGREAFDAMLARFYQEHVGRAAHMRDLLGAIRDAGYEPREAETVWLRSLGLPPAE